jgi:hypothetical protein
VAQEAEQRANLDHKIGDEALARLVVLRSYLAETLSSCHVVHSDIVVKFWVREVPSVERARPACCPRCHIGSRPMGDGLRVVGHGLRDRQLRGCIEPGCAPAMVIIRVRRYRCLGCAAVITVVPAGVAIRRHFGAGTLGLALALFGEGCSARQVRRRVGGLGAPEAHGWVTLRRWSAALARGALLPRLGPVSLPQSRSRAARAAAIVATYAPPSMSSAGLAPQAFEGAVHLARAA